MAFFGPLVNLWEGSNQGEGYLRYAKPKISNIHCKNWQVNAHISLLNEKAFDNVIDSHMNNMMASEYVHAQQKTDQRNKKMVHVYKSVNDLFSAFRRNKPISCVKCYDGTFNALIENQITSMTVMLPIGPYFTRTWSQLV